MLGSFWGNIDRCIILGIWLFLLADTRHTKGKALTVSLFTTVVLAAVCTIFEMFIEVDATIKIVIDTFVMFAFSIVYFFLLSSKDKSKRLVGMKSLLCTLLVIELFTSIITNSLLGTTNIVSVVLFSFINVAAYFLYSYFIKAKFMDKTITYEKTYLYFELFTDAHIVLTLGSLMIDGLVNHYTSRYTLLVFFSTVLLDVTFVLLFHKSVFVASSAETVSQITMKNELLEELVKRNDEIEMENRKARHDFKHHNLVLLEYAKEKDLDSIIDYLQELDESEYLKVPTKYSSNRTINNILSAYERKTERFNIKYTVECRTPKDLVISDMDLVSIIANILDNATKSCITVRNDRFINIKIIQNGIKLSIKCENSTDGTNLEFVNGIPKSTSHQGIGITSIIQTAEKYEGMYDFSIQDNVFVTSVVLNNDLEDLF